MALPRLRHLLLKCYFPVAFVTAVALLILDTITPPVVAQVRTVTVTVYVTVVQTVPVYVPVTAYVTIASVATSFITFTSTAVSISLGTVTLWNTLSLWNTVTAVTTAMGVFGAIPNMIFGFYSDAGLMGLGAIAGVAGVALLEHAKDAIQTLVENISRVSAEARKQKEKMKRDMS